MAVASSLLKKATVPTDKEIAALLPTVLKPLGKSFLFDCTALVIDAYKKHGGTETVAKGPDMRETIVKILTAKFAGLGALGI